MDITTIRNMTAAELRTLTFAAIRETVAALEALPLAEVKRVITAEYGCDTKVRLGRTKRGILDVVRISLFDLKETADRNVPTW